MPGVSIIQRKEFPPTLSLHHYIQQICETELRKEEDSEDFKKFCEETVVVREETPPVRLSSRAAGGVTVQEVLHRVIEMDIRSGSAAEYKERNVLSLGYRSQRWHSALEVKDSIGIECYFVNTLHSFFMSKNWEEVLCRVGETVLRHVLTRPVLLPSGSSFIQAYCSTVCWSQRQSSSAFYSQPLPRQSIFYNTYWCRQGLPRKHILNKGSTTPKCLVRDMLLCYSTLANLGPHRYHRNKKQRMSKWKDDNRTESVNELNNEEYHNNVALFNEKLENLKCLREAARVVLDGYKKCDISSVLDYCCPSSFVKRKIIDKGRQKPKTRRGCRAGKKPRSRSTGKCKRILLSKSDSESGNPSYHGPPVSACRSQRKASLLSKDIEEKEAKTVDGNSLLLDIQDLTSQKAFGELLDGDFRVLQEVNFVDEAQSQRCYGKKNSNAKEWSSSHEQTTRTSSNGSKVSNCVDDGSLHTQCGSNVINNFERACSPAEVTKFLQAICRKMFPRIGVWSMSSSKSTRRNYNLFMKKVEEYVFLGRWEAINLNHLCQGMKCNMIPWMNGGVNNTMCPDTEDGDSGIPCTDSADTKFALSVFLAWIFADILPQLIATSFYVTEGEGTGNRVLFYRKEDWEFLRDMGEKQMEGNFEKFATEDTDATTSSLLGKRTACAFFGVDKASVARYPRVRFVPKKKSMRAITNMKSRPNAAVVNTRPQSESIALATSKTPPATLTNMSLYNVLHVLRHTQQRHHPSACGFGVSGVDEACRRFKSYRLLNPPSVSAEKPYFIAVLDLEKCFDRVDTSRLYDLVARIVTENRTDSEDSTTDASLTVSPPLPEEHLIHKYNVSLYLPSAERFVSRNIRHVSTNDNFQSFKDVSKHLSKNHHNAIISDGVVYPSLCREELLKVLRQHLFQHVVRIPEKGTKDRKPSTIDHLYSQVKGIPQGSALSPLLCNLYYGSVEKDTFGSFEEMSSLGLTDSSSLIVRVMDDYLVVSTRKEAVSHFLHRAHRCFKHFGSIFNPSKTKVNFDVSLDVEGNAQILPRFGGSDVLWCGFCINENTLEILPSFSKLIGSGIEHSVTRECSHAGVAFRKALKGFIRPKFLPIILDSNINKFVTVAKSVYLIFLAAALRAHIYLRQGINSLRLSLLHQNTSFIFNCIRQVIEYGARLAKRRGEQCSSKCSALLGKREIVSTWYPLEWGSASHLCRNLETKIRAPTATFQGVSIQSCALSRNQVKWLGYKAFYTVFWNRRSEYSNISNMLRYCMKNCQRSLSCCEHHITTDYFHALTSCEEQFK